MKKIVKNMFSFLSALLFVFMIFFNVNILNAEIQREYSSYMDNWDKNINLASQNLRDAEKLMKSGELKKGCIKQKEASVYGVEATESLIKAFLVSGSTNDLSDLEFGLKKWRQLGQFCGRINMESTDQEISH